MAIWNSQSGLATAPPTSSSIISLQERSYAICHIPLMLPRAQIAGCILTLRACLIAVKLLDFSLCKNSQIGLEGDLKGLGGKDRRRQTKELHSLPLIAFSTEVSVSCPISASQESTADVQCAGPQNRFPTLFMFPARRHLNVAFSILSFYCLGDSFCQWLSGGRPSVCCLESQVCEEFQEPRGIFWGVWLPGKLSESDVLCFTSFSYLFFLLFNLEN